MLYGCKFVLRYCLLSSLRTTILCGIQYSVIPLTPVDCCSTGENKEVVTEVGKERESNSRLKRCSEVLGPSSPKAPVVDSNLIGHIQVRGTMETSPSFEGSISCFPDVQICII